MSNTSAPAFFLGANSAVGFASLYPELLPPDRARQRLILKGGPGCGKSSFLRAVAQTLEQAGHRREDILCSGSPDSLDAVVFPELGVSLVDGTAPHVVEPTCPAALDRYVNLCDFYDREALLPLRPELEALSADCSRAYQRAYRAIAALAQVRDNLRQLALSDASAAKLERRTRGILRRELHRVPPAPGGGSCRKRFLGGITHRGELCRFDTVQQLCGRVYELCDNYGLAQPLLETVARAAQGQDRILCPDPLEPDRLAHVLIPSLDLAFVRSTAKLSFPGEAYRRIHLDAMADPEQLRQNRARIRFSKKLSTALLEEAVACLQQAKESHDRLEEVYNPHVDFVGVYALAEETAQRLLAEQ